MGKVIKLAQPGFDVKTASDAELIYSSEWPMLKIIAQGTFSTTTGQNSIVYSHNLGYPPAYWIFSNEAITEWISPIRGVTDQRSEFNGPDQAWETVDENNLYWVGDGQTVKGTMKFQWVIFADNLSEKFVSPVKKTGGTGSAFGKTSSIKFKIAKPGKSVTSSRLEDYIVHSDARSPMLHEIVRFKLDFNTNFTYTHNLGYVPIFFSYGHGPAGASLFTPVGKFRSLPATGGASGFSSTIDKISFTSPYAGTNEFALLILKDPFEIDYRVDVRI